MSFTASFADPVAPHIAPPYSCNPNRTFYVGPSRTWTSLQSANNSGVLTAGDCVYVDAGTYPPVTLTKGGNANAPNGYVTYIGAPNWATKLTGSSYYLVDITGNYIILDGFDFDGSGIQDCVLANPNRRRAPFGHHITILNSLIHDSLGGGGICFLCSDYYTISGNTIYNTHGGVYHESGISVYEASPIPGLRSNYPADKAPFHIVISDNIAYNNTESVSPTLTGMGLL
jgi:hypothetical protein